MDDQAPDYDALLAGVRRNDQTAARALVEALHPLVRKIVRSHLPRRVAEEDLAQEVYLKMFSRLEQYRGEMPLPHWVSRIAVTTCIDQLRHQQRRPELRWADLSENEAEVLDAVLAGSDGEDATDALAAKELVRRLLDQLAPADRTVITLLDLEQKSVAEIRELTGWGTSMIKVRAFRARRKLRKLFEQLERKECP
ncbi:MAG TPA: RNA polymerase sigma factor [Opitutaceae bacterium]|nr:RNA polymerase sigma factor [Opitutaceae bacterium]